jgi:hypothetical protein
LPRTNNLVVFATKVEGMPSKSGMHIPEGGSHVLKPLAEVVYD